MARKGKGHDISNSNIKSNHKVLPLTKKNKIKLLDFIFLCMIQPEYLIQSLVSEAKKTE